MSPADAIIDAAMEAAARNREQHHLVVSQTPGSLVDYVNALARTATPEQRPHVRGMVTVIQKLCESNLAELEHERLIAGALEQLELASRPWSCRRVFREIRDGRMDVVAEECPDEILIVDGELNPKIAHEVGSRNAAALWDMLLAQRVAVAC